MQQQTNSKSKKAKTLPPFNKYSLYEKSVQAPEADVEFFQRVFREQAQRSELRTLREDFCGTFSLCCEWVRANPEHHAIGIDLDPEPVQYGRENHLSLLNEEEKTRVKILQDNVLTPGHPPADLICALNFSYFLFKERKTLASYFRQIHEQLNPGGLFIIDCFGGSKCCEANEEETEFTDEKFSYFWDQESYDPITCYSKFHIHFRRQGETKREKCFSYDWRMWSIPELKDLLQEAGFRTSVYWEQSDEDGDGNGEYTLTTQGEECEAWVAYLVATKDEFSK